jgi:glyoxylase-like metal-dependent hydrolase (beta-lactamase superfamily II)
VLSHAHADHLPGLKELTAAGAKVVALAAHWAAARAAAGLRDDQWIPLRGEWQVEAGGVRTIAADLGATPHAEHLVGLWLPHLRLLGQADLFVRRYGAVRAAGPNHQALAAALDSRGWRPERIQDGHSPWLASRQDLRDALAKQPARLAEPWQTMPDLDEPPGPRIAAALAAIGGADAVQRVGGLALTLARPQTPPPRQLPVAGHRHLGHISRRPGPVSDLLLIALVVHDWRTRGRVHRVWIAGLAR